MKTILKCAIYTRVSTDLQAEVEFNSCEAQENRIRSFIDSQENMEIFKVYSDPGFTGANLNRPGLNQILYDIRQRKINLVIAYKIDRLTRSPKDFYQLIELFDHFGVDFISVTERFDTSTPSGRLLRNIMLTFAQFERELTSERTKDKLAQRAQQGMWNGGHSPLGYKRENKKLVIDENESKAVQYIFNRYINNANTAEIFDGLVSKALLSREGTPISKTRILNVLRNPLYTGKLIYNNKTFEGKHEAIISQEMFDLAQTFHGRRRRTQRLYKNFDLAGLIQCDDCHTFMTPCFTNKVKEGKRTRYYYYRCTTTFKKGWKSCTTKQINAEKLENYIFNNLERISLDKQYLEGIIHKFNHDLESSKNPRIFEVSGVRAGLELLPESSKIPPNLAGQTLLHFVKGLNEKKGIDKNLWAKKFIKNIEYSKDKITINLFYPDEGICPNFNSSNSLVPLDTNPFALHNPAGRTENFQEISRDCMPSDDSLRAKKRPELLDAVPAGSSAVKKAHHF